ncbi:D-alanyl-D-alanine endopeptidase [Nitrosovibrio tenuis]|uniref:D-alanyl-D-alanine endopeptidase (Penicillin-binding protein 7) n=1 Tax=Nitrosovibrio tenuis TaxID=1233 RepID=A0A1H7QS73_9PROT|nr:D-alanyl-D-alanine endopeptidase [Nitrosovibrio tenuis]SEL50729.1 D-alanyl-D-alanine endopeptidase (penicillin-binding protein 7) [Nitrosovibrio tenuis]
MKKIILAACVIFAFIGCASAQPGGLNLRSQAALILDAEHGRILFHKNADAIMPIASITKLMTAIVVLDANLPLTDQIFIEDGDVDILKNTRSRLRVGSSLSRRDMLRLALMSSENRAAAALGRTYPGGIGAFVEAMNRKAFELGMGNSYFVDSTGLNSANVSTARDLAKLVDAAEDYDIIREFSTTAKHAVIFGDEDRSLQFVNSNNLVSSSNWDIGVSKTGFLSEAGRCLVMQAKITGKPVIIVLLDSWGKNTRLGDANRIKKWMETGFARKVRG